MKIIIIALLLVVQYHLHSQTAKDYYNSGWKKQTKNDFKNAIEDYTKALDIEEGHIHARYNRGLAYLMLKEYGDAMDDFEGVLEFDETYFMAPFQIATIHAQNNDYDDAEEFYTKTLEINPQFESVLAMRGQIRAVLDDTEGACEDFIALQSINEKKAEEYLLKYCSEQINKHEIFLLDWPDEENWRAGDNQHTETYNSMNLLRNDETFENWTELGNMMSALGITGADLDQSMQLLLDQSKIKCKEPILTFIEKNLATEYPWIMFTIECSEYINDDKPESKLWFLIQGKFALYMNFRALKKATIDEENKAKWIEFFKSGKIDYLSK